MIADISFCHGDALRIEDVDQETFLDSLQDVGHATVSRFGKSVTVFVSDIKFIVWSEGSDEFSCLSPQSTTQQPVNKKHGRR
jgi:hypothetical protein